MTLRYGTQGPEAEGPMESGRPLAPGVMVVVLLTVVVPPEDDKIAGLLYAALDEGANDEGEDAAEYRSEEIPHSPVIVVEMLYAGALWMTCVVVVVELEKIVVAVGCTLASLRRGSNKLILISKYLLSSLDEVVSVEERNADVVSGTPSLLDELAGVGVTVVVVCVVVGGSDSGTLLPGPIDSA